MIALSPAYYTIRHQRLFLEGGQYFYREIDRYDDMLGFSSTVGVNQGGNLTPIFQYNHRISVHLRDVAARSRDLFELWREIPGEGGDQKEHTFFYEDHIDPRVSPDETFSVYATDETRHLLNMRTVAYRSSAAGGGTLQEIEASEAMRTLVRRNTTDDEPPYTLERLVNGQMIGRTISTLEDGPKSDTVTDYDVYLQPLFDAIQGIASSATPSLPFRLVRMSTDPSSVRFSTEWQFRVYGAEDNDISADAVFSLANNNMGSPRLVARQARWANVAIVGGRGEGALRTFVLVYADDYNPLDHRELFVSARTGLTEPSLETQGAVALREHRARQQVEFTALQTPRFRYGQQYRLGDIVGVSFGGVSERHRIVSRTIDWNRNAPETLTVETERLYA